MARLLLAFDAEDETMGLFNQACEEAFREFIEMRGSNSVEFIGSARMNPVYISMLGERAKGAVFAAYSHGTETSLHVKNWSYVACDENHHLFEDSLFYSVSCHSAKFLGHKLIESGCGCFIGYSDEFNFWDGWKQFAQCANYGLFRFLEGSSTEKAVLEMKEEYDRAVDETADLNAVVAALLSSNKRNLRRYGSNLRIEDLS